MHQTGGGSNYIRMPDGYGPLIIKAGKYRLDIMSYEVKKGKGEDGGNPFFEAGELGFERTFWIHRDIGPNNDWHLCAAKTMNQPCPVCEYRAKLARDPNADEETIRALAPKERQLWIVKDLNDPDENYILEMSHHLFGKQLDAKIRDADEEDGYEFFADPVEGLTVRVAFNQSDAGKWVEATDIEFRPRKTQYDEDVIDDMPDLDAMLVATPYDKLKALFLQTGDDEPEDDDNGDDEPEEKPERTRKTSSKSKSKTTRSKKKPTTAKQAGLEEGDTVEYDGDEYEIIRISKDGTSLSLEQEDGTRCDAIGCDEVKKIEVDDKDDSDGDEDWDDWD